MKLLEDNFEIKHTVAGPGPDMDREIKVLGRIISYHDWGWSMEADPSLVEASVEKLGLRDGKGVSAPGAKPDSLDGATDMKSRRLDPIDVENQMSYGLDMTILRLYREMTFDCTSQYRHY